MKSISAEIENIIPQSTDSAPLVPSTKPPRTSFLSLPRELRQSILLIAINTSWNNHFNSSGSKIYTASRYNCPGTKNGFIKGSIYPARRMILALQLVLVEPEVAKDIEWVEEKCTIRLSRIAREFGILEEGRRWTRLSRWGISRCEVERWRDWRNWEVLLEQYQEKSE